MNDATESIRRQRVAEINLEPGSREALEAKNTGKSGPPMKCRLSSVRWASWPR